MRLQLASPILRPRWAAALLALIAYAAAVPTGAQEPSASIVADRLRAYLEALEPKLSALVADERFEQSITAVSESGTAQVPIRRVLVSEVGFVRLPDDHAWLGHRLVQRINGRTVRAGAPQLQDLFSRSGTEQLAMARRISDENARYNLGHPRSTNVPTLPLDLLHPRHRDAYTVSMGDVSRRNGVRIARLEFAEGPKGALVAYDERTFVRSVVLAWVDVEAGGLERAEVTLVPPVRARENHVVRVDFALDARLGIRVPVRLTERFWAGGTGEGEATYRNYRRFETGARLVPPAP